MVTRIGLKSAKPVRTYFKEWREWKGWSQQELADRMETTRAQCFRHGKFPLAIAYRLGNIGFSR